MTLSHRVCAWSLSLILAACGSVEGDGREPTPEPSCEDTGDCEQTCESEGSNCAEPSPEPECPDAADPTVHYISDDPAQCGLTDCGGPETDCVPCAGDQEYFQDECGCGCIDLPPAPLECPSETDPTVHYISTDPAECGQTDCGPDVDCIPCEASQEYFENECGCGCIDAST